jgi:hypothetical protein
VRAAARPADDREPVEVKQVGDSEHVEDFVGDCAAAIPRGAAVARAIGCDVPDTGVYIHGIVEHPAVSAPGSSVQADDGIPIWIAAVNVR